MSDRTNEGSISLICVEPSHPRRPLHIQWNRAVDMIEIWGGDSPHTKTSPYQVPGWEVEYVDEALHWVAHLSGKRWAGGYKFWNALRKAVLVREEAHGR